MKLDDSAHAAAPAPPIDASRAIPTLGGRLRRRRLATGLSQQELASLLGVSRSIISYWEADKRSPDEGHFVLLAGALRTSREMLTAGIAAPFPARTVRLLMPPGAPPVGETIRQLRILRGLTTDELARASGVDRGTITDVEIGRHLPVPAKLVGLSEALDATFQALLDGSALSGGRPPLLVRLPRLGQRVGALRRLKRLSQDQLAARAGVIRAQISAIELGRTRTTRQTLERLAEALGSSVAELTDGLPPGQLPVRRRGRGPRPDKDRPPAQRNDGNRRDHGGDGDE